MDVYVHSLKLYKFSKYSIYLNLLFKLLDTFDEKEETIMKMELLFIKQYINARDIFSFITLNSYFFQVQLC